MLNNSLVTATCNLGRFRSSNNSIGTEVSPELQYTAAGLQELQCYIVTFHKYATIK